MATNDFKAFAIGVGANVLSQSAYVTLTSLISNGFQSGTADSEQLNKVWRQSSVMASVLGDLIAKQTGQDVLDNGAPGTILTNLQAAVLYSTIATAVGGTANAITATFPFVPGVSDLVNGMTFRFKAASSTTSTTPTFTPNSGTVPAKTIVKGNNLPLSANDILTNMWVTLVYDSTLDKWVITNPATGFSNFENVIATSGSAAYDISGIPAGIKKLRLWFNGVTTNGTSTVVIRLGSGTIDSSGYSSVCFTNANVSLQTSGFVLAPFFDPTDLRSGKFELERISGNSFTATGLFTQGQSSGAFNASLVGTKTLSGDIDSVRITTSNGTDLFDGGNVKIEWEL